MKLSEQYTEWILSHLESIFFILGSTIVCVYFDKYNKKRTKFLCILNGMVACIIICLVYFICTKAGLNYTKYLISTLSPFMVRPLISRLLSRGAPMWDNIFELVDKKITKALKK